MSREERRRWDSPRSTSPERRHRPRSIPRRDTYFPEPYRERDQAGPSRSTNAWDPPPIQRADYYEPPAPSVSYHQTGDPLPPIQQVEALASALTSVIQRSGRREVARAVAERLKRFGGGTAEDAQRQVEAAEEDVRTGTVALQLAFVTLLRSALVANGRLGMDDEAVEAIRVRVERLERRVRSPSPERRSPPPPRHPAVPPMPATGFKPTRRGARGKRLGEIEREEGSSEQSAEERDAKRGRARALLEEVLARLEIVEGKADSAVESHLQVADDVSVLESNLLFQDDKLDELIKRISRRRPKESDAGDPPSTAEATEKQQSARPAIQSSGGEADMDIDGSEEEDGEVREKEKDDGGGDNSGGGDVRESSVTASAAIELLLPTNSSATARHQPGDRGLVDEMTRLREQMALMERRLDGMQSAGPAASTEATDVDKPDGEPTRPQPEASSQQPKLSPPPNEVESPPSVSPEELNAIWKTLRDLSAQFAGLQLRVDALSKVDVAAMIQAERGHIQTAVQNLLTTKWKEMMAGAEAAMEARLEAHIVRAVPAVLAQEIRAAAAKSPIPSRPQVSQSAPPPTLAQSPPVPLLHRLSGANANEPPALGLAQRISDGSDVRAQQIASQALEKQHMQQHALPDKQWSQQLAQVQGQHGTQQQTSHTEGQTTALAHPQLQQGQQQQFQQQQQQHQQQQQQQQQLLQASMQRQGSNGGNSVHSMQRQASNGGTSVLSTLPHGNSSTTQQQAASVSTSATAFMRAAPNANPNASLATTQTNAKIPTKAQLEAAGLSPKLIIDAKIPAELKIRLLQQWPGWTEQYRQSLLRHQAASGGQHAQHCQQFAQQAQQQHTQGLGPLSPQQMRLAQLIGLIPHSHTAS
ncbi:hypothetical protein CC85DRAFT_287678 [Cutaneotrichosporon oleaginosum]|uniref:Uncharacterized protein n=1 Tax=Cutaneotrichosporon oleaginosum TaxID=879819 RepID=A0A0J1AY57_9TREE|nr:uncharacterized protein CC85DRAFT_287678 [Cutaneotrichosporon oleaginosum]KLT40264.1 hypothetical protein CC85DRAFT_287678 [Cutaneotrichosporon oleaginosum]TXT11287.1 hypothetical protein COLE_01697 [Cutaneotrichosporon oleaginosum]